jgi:AcrR family transcriptional regulator
MPKRAPALTRSEKKALTRVRILTAAREVFFEKGFADANLDEIARRANVAKGSVYTHVSSKAELYFAVLTQGSGKFESRLRDAAHTGDTALAKLASVAQFYTTHWSTYPSHFKIFWAFDNQDVIGQLPDAVTKHVGELWQRSLALIEAVIEEGVRSGEFVPCNPRAIAYAFWRVANAGVQILLVERSTVVTPPPGLSNEFLALLTRGLLAAPGDRPRA